MLLSVEWSVCPYCGHVIDYSNPNQDYKPPSPNPPNYKPPRRNLEQWIDEKGAFGPWIVLLVIVGGVLFAAWIYTHISSNSEHHSTSHVTASPSPVDSPPTTAWIPAGYSLVPGVSSTIAIKRVPQGQLSPCTWCSRSHGQNVWELDVVSPSTCANFYMNTAIFSQSGSLEKYWYQKLQNTPSAPQTFRVEVVTADPSSTYKITEVTCGS